MALDAAFHRNDGTRDEPGRDSEWSAWVAGSKIYNYCEDGPLIDWLDLWGRQKGVVADDERPGYDDRTNFRTFLFARGAEFERVACEYLARRHQFVTIRSAPEDRRTRVAVEATWAAMQQGTEIIAQGVLWNPENRTYGAPDLPLAGCRGSRRQPRSFWAGRAGSRMPG